MSVCNYYLKGVLYTSSVGLMTKTVICVSKEDDYDYRCDISNEGIRNDRKLANLAGTMVGYCVVFICVNFYPYFVWWRRPFSSAHRKEQAYCIYVINGPKQRAWVYFGHCSGFCRAMSTIELELFSLTATYYLEQDYLRGYCKSCKYNCGRY